ncbi:ATP12 chaperone protein [Rhodobacteraceae bacterium THAF1]|uniref:ATP12 family chaperone protein n=1 Tax=Palleronia sp. THAF1 TaxID=2587842 RepID=UPI000F3F3168|nr:ATP12 family protein [Palleronia sp. THAF1]QFU07666.1 ATP12 chaperone protein [Palleronia sp. THAF1]VDC23109.1 ATP12 chaperone protein [Rhodobacteraceae bacterium THAF1]
MTNWAARRFWKEAKGEQVADGWQVMLDTRPIRTPAGAALVVPTQPLAGAIASEWDAQEDIVDPRTMPMTRTANSAIDKVAPQKNAVVSILSDYGATDLLSYRADSPRALMMRQSQLWDPILEWADRELGARLAVTEGVMPVPQDGAALDRLTAPMLAMSAFQLAAFHDLVALSGSLVLAHATTQGVHSPSEAWELSRLDEDWQAEQWGEDEEARDAADRKRASFLEAHRFWALAS